MAMLALSAESLQTVRSTSSYRGSLNSTNPRNITPQIAGEYLPRPWALGTHSNPELIHAHTVRKTLICLAVILATKDHLPEPPPQHERRPRTRSSVPSLLDLAVSSAGSHFIPA